MRTRIITPFGLVLAWTLAVALCFSEHTSAQETGYDDDTALDFVWTPPEGNFDHYNIYLSVDGLDYQLDGTSSTEAYTVAGENGHDYKVKVTAVTSEGLEGPSSPESDPAICDTLAPLSPVISGTYDVLNANRVALSLESGPTDTNFSNYQVLGGQYTDWTDTSQTSTFVFTVNPDSQNVLQIREKDLAGNVGPAGSLTVENLSGDNDSDGIPNYWEYMYNEILDADDPGDANIDSDGDGWSNYEEFLAGTDPTRQDSSPQDTIPPVITLSGDNPFTMEVGTPYAEPGYAATDNHDGDITANVVVTGSVDHTVPGTYTLRYNVSDSSGNAAQQKTRTVTVGDTTAPVITLSGDNPFTMEVGTPYAEPGYAATDNYDGDITANVVVTGSVDHTVPGTYTLRYNVSDSSGNAAQQKTRTVTVGDTTAPVITLSGDNPFTMEVGTPYAEPGYAATDNYDGDITANVVVTGSVDHTVPGTYTLRYNVSDSSGNAAQQKTRTVTVMDTTPPATSAHSPAKGATGVPVNTSISFHISDADVGVDKGSIVVTVNGVPMMPTITGAPADYLVTYYPMGDFQYSETVTVTIEAQDLHSPPNVMPRETYTFTTMPKPDNTAPSTSGHVPAKGAVNVPVDTSILFHVQDGEDGVDRSSIAMTVNGVPVTPVITGTPADYLITYDPPTDFDYTQTITVTIDAQDLGSPPNVMPTETYTFTTMPEPDNTPPSTWGHVPGRSAVDVAVDTTISFHIKDAGDGVDKASIVMTVDGSPVVPTITGTPADYLVTYDPPADFNYSQRVTVTVDAQDRHSPPNVMATETYTFRTIPRPDDAPPQTSGHFPARGAGDANPDTPISVHITDSGKGVDRDSIAMTVNGQPVTPTISGTAEDYLVTCVPPLEFDYGQTVTVTIDAQDLNSPPNVMATDSYTFTVMPSPDTTPPFTSAHSPGRGATGVPINTSISFHITDNGDGVDISSIVMKVNGSLVVPSITGTVTDCLVSYDPPTNFDYGQSVVLTVEAQDLHSPANVMDQDRYEFTTAPAPENDPAASDPNVFFFENFEDGDLDFPRWDPTNNANAIATGDLAIVEGTLPGSGGSKVLHLGAARGLGAGLVNHFAPMDTVYCRWYARFGPGFDQGNLLRFVALAADSTGDLYKVGDVCPNGYDYYRSSLDFTTAWGRHAAPGEAILYTYYAGMKPKYYDADGDGVSELNWPGNEFHSGTPVFVEDDQWHCMEVVIRANTPGINDGEQALWIDGELVGYWSGLNWRLTDALKPNCLWLRIGLPELSLSNQVWIDNVALSTAYIGLIDGSHDETPVVIEDLSVKAVGHTSAKIAWQTNKPATSIVVYGEAGSDSEVFGDTSLVTGHRVKLNGLVSGAEYHCRIICRDATAANEAVSENLTFTTLPSSKGVFTEEWGDASETTHPGTVQDTYISVADFAPDGGKQFPAGPSESPTLCAYTFPAGKPATALLMKWDLFAIPPTAEILDAKLYLYMFDAQGDVDYSMSVHEVIGVDPVVSEASGEHYKKGFPWDPFSGLYNDVPLAQSNIAPPEDVVNVGDVVNEYKAWTVTGMVSQWITSPSRNQGLIVNPDPEASAGSYRYFRSSSHGDPSQRPRLIVTCRTSRGQNLSWEDGAFVIKTESWLAEQYITQSADEPGGPWTNETDLLKSPWWHSGDLGTTRKKFFRLQTGY